LGKPDVTDPRCWVIMDAQALPIEGFETSVVADNDEVINYMIELGEVNELSRQEKFCGWYHTHPFEVEVNSHCYLSSTDVTTQLQWQRHSDPQGDPWFAIVIDPQRSLVKRVPEMMCFRVHDPSYSPPANQTPDGTLVTDEKKRLEKWGVCWNRYYRLDIGYFMSDLAQTTLGILKNNALWMDSFATTPLLVPDKQQGIAERVTNITQKLHIFDTIQIGDQGKGEKNTRARAAALEMGLDDMEMDLSSTVTGSTETDNISMKIGGIADTAVSLAQEHCEGCACQMAKFMLFGLDAAKKRKAQRDAAVESSSQMDS
jgi:COP9 signalosome complex subunit 5